MKNIFVVLIFVSLLSFCFGCSQVNSPGNSTTAPPPVTTNPPVGSPVSTIGLLSLDVTPETLVPAFSTNVYAYTVAVANATQDITLTATSSQQAIKINNNIVSKSAGYLVFLNVGANLITIEAGSTYEVTVTRASPATAAAGTFYVAVSGSNTTGDGSKAKPWATPGYGSRQLSAGNTLIIESGEYVLTDSSLDVIKPLTSGSEALPIIISGEGQTRPILSGKNTSASSSGLNMAIDLDGLSNIVISNLEISHDSKSNGSEIYFRNGISVRGATQAKNITLSNLYIHHVDGSAVALENAENVKISDCRFDYCATGGIAGTDSQIGEIKSLTVSNCDITNTGLYYQGGDGSSRPLSRPPGIKVVNSTGPVTVSGTLVQNGRGDAIKLQAANSTVKNCEILDNSGDGIVLSKDKSKIENCLIAGAGEGTLGIWSGIVIQSETANASFEVVNVTLNDNPTRIAYPMYVQYDYQTIPIYLIMRNSIIANGQTVLYLGPSVGYTLENNLIYAPLRPGQVAAGNPQRDYSASEVSLLGAGNISADPKFVNAALNDFHLQAGSPGINSGTSSGAPSTDISGISRPQGSGYDMGVYEKL